MATFVEFRAACLMRDGNDYDKAGKMFFENMEDWCTPENIIELHEINFATYDRISYFEGLLEYIAQHNDFKSLKKLLDSDFTHNAPVDRQEVDTLKYFVLKNHTQCAKWLMDNTKIDINAYCEGGTLTPLHLAILSDNVDCVNLLIERGANVNAPDPNGNTPLHYVAYEKFNADVFLKLLNADNIDLTTQNKFGDTFLHTLLDNQRIPDEVKCQHLKNIFLKHSDSIDIDITNNDGESLLDVALANDAINGAESNCSRLLRQLGVRQSLARNEDGDNNAEDKPRLNPSH